VTQWHRHEPGATPDGRASAIPFYTLDHVFVLNDAPA
jgi:hydroxyquinol 1,2-dioxygenase